MSTSKPAPANRLRWRPMAIADREAIFEYIARDNPTAALELDVLIESKAERARQDPLIYRTGRKPRTRELVAHPNYLLIYRHPKQPTGEYLVEILRVVHARRQWP